MNLQLVNDHGELNRVIDVLLRGVLPEDLVVVVKKMIGCPFSPPHFFAFKEGLFHIEEMYLRQWQRGIQINKMALPTYWGGVVSRREDRLRRFKVYLKYPLSQRYKFKTNILLPIEKQRIKHLANWISFYREKKKWDNRL